MEKITENEKNILEYSVRDPMNEVHRVRYVTQEIKGMDKENTLVNRFRFDTLVWSKDNELVYSVAKMIADNPGEGYNPFYIYGESGVGKTHILHAIANEVLQKHPNKKVLYTTSEGFTNEMISTLRDKMYDQDFTLDDFRKKYRNVDVLLVDDIQFLIGKEATQEEFFYTLNDAFLHGCQIIISSDIPPNQLTTLDAKFKTQFPGIVARIDVPDYNTRKAILKQKIREAHYEQYEIADEIIAYIADNITSCVRKLEGALHKVVAYSRLNKQIVSLPLVKEILQDVVTPVKKVETSPEYILEMISQYYSIKKEDIIGKRRDSKSILARQLTMYFLRMKTELTLKEIGEFIGVRNHVIVLYGIKKIEEEKEKKPTLKSSIALLEKMMSNHCI